MSPVIHYIYVIGRDEGPVKVGITSNLQSRISSIRTGCPFPIKLLYVHPCECRQKALEHEGVFHDVYAEKRLEGEWFDLDAELAIEGVQTGFDLETWFSHRAALERIAEDIRQ